MNTLEQFYKSKVWESFRKVIIEQRTDSDGFVRCALCGKPILKKYDLIIHHKKELTEANVADVEITLNPSNVECVHFKCHNKIHDRWQGGNGGWKPQPKHVYIVYGAPCSGKSTWVSTTATADDLVVDLDNIWQAISINNRYDKPPALRGTVFELRDKLYDIIKYRSGKWHNAYVITGGALSGDRERLQKRINADDFVFVECDKEECLKRTETKGLSDDQKELWKGYIEEWFSRYQPNL